MESQSWAHRNTPFTRDIAIDVSIRNTASFTAEIFEILSKWNDQVGEIENNCVFRETYKYGPVLRASTRTRPAPWTHIDHLPRGACNAVGAYLPASVPRNSRDNQSKTRRSSETRRSINVVNLTTRTTFFSKFHNDVGAHEALAVEMMESVFSVPGAFKLNKTKA